MIKDDTVSDEQRTKDAGHPGTGQCAIGTEDRVLSTVLGWSWTPVMVTC